MTDEIEIRTTTYASALAWICGLIDDDGLAAGHDVIYWRELPNRASYREGLARIAALHRQGFQWMLVRACHPVTAHKLRREKCEAGFVEPRFYRGQDVIATRFLCPPAQMNFWLGRIKP
jgi:hypothetical protein